MGLTPDAPISAQCRVLRLCRSLFFRLAFLGAAVLGLGNLPGAGSALAEEARLDFDIAAQPLTRALEAFSILTGYQILMADSSAAGTQSAPVKALLAPREALVAIVAGTGLTVRFTTETSAVLMPDGNLRAAPREARPAATASFEADLQRGATRVLCEDQLTRPGTYRAALDIWINAAGGIDRAELLSSTGNDRRDERVLAVLRSLVLKPPPSGLSQPTTLLFLPMAAGRACAGVSSASALPAPVMQ
jgi:TonB family protein